MYGDIHYNMSGITGYYDPLECWPDGKGGYKIYFIKRNGIAIPLWRLSPLRWL